MHDVCAVSLLRAPMPELAVPITDLAEQPHQADAECNAQERFVDAEPTPHKARPSAIAADIIADAQKCADGESR